MSIDVEGFDNPAEVTVTDYCAERCSTSNRIYSVMRLEEFFKFERPTWTKVRWINVVGLNWRFIKFLARKYHLHRLAVEDLLSVQRTKIDTYQDRILSRHMELINRYLRLFTDACPYWR
jgi:Mg2+ and Co2+ transporter CorA